ncbi:MAG TPA: TetR/AcrR family transcriptional regulator [Paraburkholderia sp.]|nr:TetR/AcrR family transcriptional regulator [Paraburkholderia sp.]
MGHSQADKIASHQRIVDIAARRFRERGIDGISIADLMKEAGLTVGGFYKHFASRDELVAEAFDHALHDNDAWETAVATAPRQAMRTYISEAHRDSVETGCPLATLANDISRSTDEARDIYTDNVKRVLDLISKSLPAEDGTNKRSEAALVLSACVGSVLLSRAVSDPKLSKQILDGALANVLDLFATKRSRK